jgi:asparaginyl-tRNA synthetase
MKRSKIFKLLKSDGPVEQVLIKGWVRTRRDSKGFSFIEVNDGSSLKNIQVVADEKLSNYEDVKKLTTGSALAVGGQLVESKGGGQKWEILAETVEIIHLAPEDFPLQKKRHTDEFLRSIAHLRPRTNKYGAAFRIRSEMSYGTTNKYGAAFRIRSEMSYGIHKFFRDRGFRYLHSPILTGSDCEGAGEMFRVTTLDMNNPKRRPGRLRAGFFRQRSQPDRFRAIIGRDVCAGPGRCLHLRAHLPGGKFKHPPPCRRVLDGGTGDGLL